MHSLTFIISLSVLCLCVNCNEISHHRHRHSHSQSREFDLDRLMNRLDSQSSSLTKPTHRTPKLSEPEDFNGLDVTSTESTTDPGNSLWDDDSVGETSTYSPLDSERWEKILKGKTDKVKQQEALEDAEDDLEERSQEEEEGFEDQQVQADSYSRHWSSKSGETYTNWKIDNLGNRKSVDNMFQVYRSGLLKPDSSNKGDLAQEVYRHNKQMSKETLCRVPRPKVIRVSDIYPSSNKLYVPACTVLHQCGDDTGCCGGSAQRCGPKTTKRVELYFSATYVMNSRQRIIEKLPFYNHTECECIDKMEEVMPRDSQGGEYRTERNSEPGCKCPSEYTVRWLANGSCTCDCFDKQRDCIKYKKGKEYFNHSDRLCIEMGTCQLPSCDFGVYLRSVGRCPRKHEKYRSWSRYH